jgi:hypothetical protein
LRCFELKQEKEKERERDARKKRNEVFFENEVKLTLVGGVRSSFDNFARFSSDISRKLLPPVEPISSSSASISALFGSQRMQKAAQW